MSAEMSSSDHDIIEISSETGGHSANESDGEEENPQAITKPVKKKLTRTRNKQKPSRGKKEKTIFSCDHKKAARRAPKAHSRLASFRYILIL